MRELAIPNNNSSVEPVSPRQARRAGPAHREVAPPLGAGDAGAAAVTLLSPTMIAQLRKTLSDDMREHLSSGFATVLPGRLTAIENAIRSGDREALRHAAHLLRGTSATLGASRLSEMCRTLEHANSENDPVVAESQITRLAAVAAETQRALQDELV